MPGTQKWKDEEIWFILRKKRQGQSNATVLSSFRLAYPKHMIASTNPINYVWNHYNYIPEYDEEKDSEFLTRQLGQEDAQRAVIEQNQRNNGYQANAGDNANTGSGLLINSIEAANAIGLVSHELAPTPPNMFGGTLPATLNSAQLMNILKSTFTPSNTQAFQSLEIQSGGNIDQPTTIQNFNPQQGTRRPNPHLSFNSHSRNTSTALPQHQSQLHPPQNFSRYASPSSNYTQSQSNSGKIAKKQPKRPQPTSIHRSNAHFTGFRQRRASHKPARPTLPPPVRRILPVLRQIQVKRAVSPPVRIPQPQVSRIAPVEVAQYKGYRMTFDTSDTSGLPYAIFDPQDRRVFDRERIPPNVFRNLSMLCASQRVAQKQSSLSKEEMDNQQQSPDSNGRRPLSHRNGAPIIANGGDNVRLGASLANANGGQEQRRNQEQQGQQPGLALSNSQTHSDLHNSQTRFNHQASGVGQPEGNGGQSTGNFEGMQTSGSQQSGGNQGSLLALTPIMSPYNWNASSNLPQSSSTYPGDHRPINANTNLFQAATATQQHSIINIVDARFVGPFIIPSPGRGWSLSNARVVPPGATYGQILRRSFTLTNASGDSVVNITGATFEQGLAMEEDNRQIGSANLPISSSPNQPVATGPVTDPFNLIDPSTLGQTSSARPGSACGTPPQTTSASTPPTERQSLPAEGTPTNKQRVEASVVTESSQPPGSPLSLPAPAIEYDEFSQGPKSRSPGLFAPPLQPKVITSKDMPAITRQNKQIELDSLPAFATSRSSSPTFAPALASAPDLVSNTRTREERGFDQLMAESQARERAQAQRDSDDARVMTEMDEYFEREGH